MKRVLYIEDDEVDVLWWNRITAPNTSFTSTIKNSLSELNDITFLDYDLIICDGNLPDANFAEVKEYFAGINNVYFLSGTLIDGERIIQKPISLNHIIGLLSPAVVDLSYIKSLSEGDIKYEQEMIQTALKVLPDRLYRLKIMGYDKDQIRQAAHKAKSSFRVCGMQTESLELLEDIAKREFNHNEVDDLLSQAESQIVSALRDLNSLLD